MKHISCVITFVWCMLIIQSVYTTCPSNYQDCGANWRGDEACCSPDNPVCNMFLEDCEAPGTVVQALYQPCPGGWQECGRTGTSNDVSYCCPPEKSVCINEHMLCGDSQGTVLMTDGTDRDQFGPSCPDQQDGYNSFDAGGWWKACLEFNQRRYCCPRDRPVCNNEQKTCEGGSSSNSRILSSGVATMNNQKVTTRRSVRG